MDRYIAIDLKVDVLIHYAKNGVLDIAVENNHYTYMAGQHMLSHMYVHKY